MHPLLNRLGELRLWYRQLKFVPQLLVFQAGAAALMALPVVAYRLAEGDYRQAAINGAILLALIVTSVLGARRPQRLAKLLFAGTYVAAAWFITLYRGALGAYWSYPVACAIFFVLRGREAYAVSALTAALCAFVIHSARGSFEALQYLSTYGLVSVFSARYAMAMRDEKDRLAVQAYTDPLTGIRNRRQLDEDLQALLAPAGNGHGPAMTLTLIDIDHFKRVNDTFGHATGDAFLRRLTAVIERELDMRHRLYRYGGEEFVVLSLVEPAAAVTALDRVREVVAGSRLIREREEPITISMGLAAYHPGMDATGWIGAADLAMYESKANGRNRLTVSR